MIKICHSTLQQLRVFNGILFSSDRISRALEMGSLLVATDEHFMLCEARKTVQKNCLVPKTCSVGFSNFFLYSLAMISTNHIQNYISLEFMRI